MKVCLGIVVPMVCVLATAPGALGAHHSGNHHHSSAVAAAARRQAAASAANRIQGASGAATNGAAGLVAAGVANGNQMSLAPSPRHPHRHARQHRRGVQNNPMLAANQMQGQGLAGNGLLGNQLAGMAANPAIANQMAKLAADRNRIMADFQQLQTDRAAGSRTRVKRDLARLRHDFRRMQHDRDILMRQEARLARGGRNANNAVLRLASNRRRLPQGNNQMVLPPAAFPGLTGVAAPRK